LLVNESEGSLSTILREKKDDAMGAAGRGRQRERCEADYEKCV